jgi:hypothetical protein
MGISNGKEVHMEKNIETTEDALATLSKRDRWKATTMVRLNATKNPKKKGTMSYERFEHYFGLGYDLEGGVTVQDALDAGVRMDDIRHDSAHGFISLDEGAGFPALAGREMVEGDI